MRLEARALRVSLWAAAITALALLSRTAVWFGQGAYAYLRPWATVIAAVVLLTAAVAGLRGRTWGVLVAGVTAAAFAGAAILGIAPTWFFAVAGVGIAPVLVSSRRLFGFDARAAFVAITVALVIGSGAALFAGPGLEILGFY